MNTSALQLPGEHFSGIGFIDGNGRYKLLEQ